MEEIKAKVNGLRGRFHNELSKLRNNNASGSGTDNMHKVTSQFFKKLLFLKDYISTRKSFCNAPGPSTSTNNFEENEMEITEEDSLVGILHEYIMSKKNVQIPLFK